MGMPVEPVYTHGAWRFRDNVPDPSGVDAAFDGGDTAEGTTPSLQVDTLYRLRVRMDQTEATANVSGNLATNVRVQFNQAGAGWTNLGSEGSGTQAVEFDTPTGFSDGDNTTTTRLSAANLQTGDGLAAQDSDVVIFATEATSQIEFEIAFRLNAAHANNGASIQIRLLYSNDDESPPATVVGGSDIPTLTVVNYTVNATAAALSLVTYPASVELLLSGAPQLTGTPATTVWSTDQANPTINMPSGIQAGDGLLAVVAVDEFSNAPTNISETSGADYVRLGFIYHPDDNILVAVFWKASADADSSDNLDITIDAAERGSAIVYRITGHDPATTPDIQSATSSGSSSAPNPPSLTPAGGSDKYLWVALGGSHGAETWDTGPSGFGAVTHADGDASGASTGLAARQFEGSVLDPSAFGLSAASQGWGVFTVAFTPAAGGDTNVDATKASLTLATYAATVNAETNALATVAAMSLATYAADVNLDRIVAATTQTMSLVTYPATVNAETNVQATTASLALATYPATVNAELNIAAGVVAQTLTTYAADVNLNRVVQAASITMIVNQLYADLPGEANDYLSTPDSVPVSITGDIDLRINMILRSVPSGTAGHVISKWRGTSGNFSYAIQVSTGARIQFLGSFSGTAADLIVTGPFVNSTPNILGKLIWLRVTRDASTGVVTFYYSYDNGQTWDLRSQPTNTSGSLFDGDANLTVGNRHDGTTNPLDARVYRVQVYDGIDGTLAAEFYPYRDASDGDTSVVSGSTGETWTVHQSGTPKAEITHPGKATISLHRNVAATTAALSLATYTATVTLDTGTNVLATAQAMQLATYGATISLHRSVSATAATLSLVTYAATVNAETNALATVAAMTLATYPATVNAEVNAQATIAALSLATYPATVSLHLDVQATSQGMSLVTYQATISLGVQVAVTLGTMSLAMQQATISLHRNVAATVVTMSLQTYPASLAQNINVNATTATLQLATYGAVVNAETNAQATVASMALVTYPATVNAETNVAATVSALSLATYGAAVSLDRNVQVGAASMSLVTYPATIVFDVEVFAGVASLQLVTYNAVISGSVNVAATVAALNLVTYQAQISLHLDITVATAALQLSLYPAVVNAETNVLANISAMNLSTYPATIGFASGTLVVASFATMQLQTYKAVINQLFLTCRTCGKKYSILDTEPNYFFVSSTYRRGDYASPRDIHLAGEDILECGLDPAATKSRLGGTELLSGGSPSGADMRHPWDDSRYTSGDETSPTKDWIPPLRPGEDTI